MARTNDRAPLSNLLDARLPEEWPPPLNDDASARFFADYLAAHPDAAGWMLWYFVRDENGSRIAIGNGGFKGKPVGGTVEVGYSIVTQFQSFRGRATHPRESARFSIGLSNTMRCSESSLKRYPRWSLRRPSFASSVFDPSRVPASPAFCASKEFAPSTAA